MKKGYKALELETVKFEPEDVITASSAACKEFDDYCTEDCRKDYEDQN